MLSGYKDTKKIIISTQKQKINVVYNAMQILLHKENGLKKKKWKQFKHQKPIANCTLSD